MLYYEYFDAPALAGVFCDRHSFEEKAINVESSKFNNANTIVLFENAE